jgi:N,N-dimethylformamidase
VAAAVKETTPAELPVTGYLDRFSHRAGEAFQAYISVREGGRCTARLVRVIGGDPNPTGPGMNLLDQSDRFAIEFDGRRQPINLGSYARIPCGPPRVAKRPCTWSTLVWPGTLVAAPAVLLSEDSDQQTVFSLAISRHGARATFSAGQGQVTVATSEPLRARQWYRIWASCDPETGRLVVGQVPVGATFEAPAIGHALAQGLQLPRGDGQVLLAAQCGTPPSGLFTGKLEDPAILACYCDRWDLPLAGLEDFGNALTAGWDFSRDISSQRVYDIGPYSRHGALVNGPTRGVTGARWRAREMCWRHAPRDYAAIHFHDDDLADCGWQSDFEFPVPADLPSGAYALHVQCAEGEDWLPLFVLPGDVSTRSRVALLIPTFTYQAYANYARHNSDAPYWERVKAWDAYAFNPDDYPIYGRATYNCHADGSGIAYSTRLRPILNMRPGFLAYCDPKGSGLRTYPADTHLLGWLEAKGVKFDVITDEDLDECGVELIESYRVVLTCTHPEYQTTGTLDALRSYTAAKGRLMYLGGNGFYWHVARHPDMPHVIEIRRGEGGIRGWAAEPGEYYNAFDGQYGGLWRRNGRPPQQLVGVGFSAQGIFEGVAYRRLAASFEERFAWMFKGIDETLIGSYGLSGGGAAGFELDRADATLGTAPNAVILARSEPLPASFILPPEEILTHIETTTGESPNDLMRGEIVYFETPGGGAVFSVGSITFCGSLWRAGWQGPISQLLENVLHRFSESQTDRIGRH